MRPVQCSLREVVMGGMEWEWAYVGFATEIVMCAPGAQGSRGLCSVLSMVEAVNPVNLPGPFAVYSSLSPIKKHLQNSLHI